MAKATAKTSKPDVTLELTGEEADVLYTLLSGEAWPKSDKHADLLNGIHGELCDIESTELIDDDDFEAREYKED